MPHPVHDILKRFFDIEQSAFDTEAREFWPASRRDAWPSERFVQAFAGESPGTNGELSGSDGDYLEREGEN
jgi:hypothetical protein